MATLKGMFAPAPRTKRNFLIENKRDVRVRSISNSTRSKVSTDLSQKQRIPSAFPQHSSKIQLSSSKGSMEALTSKQKIKGCTSLKPNSTNSLQSKREPAGKFNIMSSKQAPSREASCNSRKTATGSQTVQYSDQENVPFQWTEVCPSLISHNICHQGVQTEDSNRETLDKMQGYQDIDKIHDDLDSFLTKDIPKGAISSEDGHSSDCVSIKDSSAKVKDTIKNRNKVEIIPKLSPRVHQQSSAQTNVDILNEQSSQISDLHNLKIPYMKQFTCTKQVHGEHPSSYQKGVIPKYLSKRKAEQAEAAARAKEIDPNCPEGHVAMSDSERRETLDTILKNYNELISELNKIPVRTDTLKMKQRKIEIEKQLDKLEGGIRIFSRSKVYVKIDA